MNWHTFASTLLGALFTFSGILFTQALDLQRRKRDQKKLIHALMQGLHDEIAGLLDFARTNSVHPIEAVPDGTDSVRVASARRVAEDDRPDGSAVNAVTDRERGQEKGKESHLHAVRSQVTARSVHSGA